MAIIRYTIYSLFIIIFAYMSYYATGVTFTDQDPVIYTIIGKYIYNGIGVPYTIAFDHKPFFIYIIYGLLYKIIGLSTSLFVIESIIFCVVCGLLSCIYFNLKIIYTPLFSSVIFIVSYEYLGFSANSEYVMFITSFLSLIFISKKDFKYIALSAIMASISFTTNYLSFFFIAPSVLYSIFSLAENSISNKIKRLSFYTLMFALFFLLSHSILIFGGISNVYSYYELQHWFLSSYGGGTDGVIKALRFFSKDLLIVIFISFLSYFDNTDNYYDKRKVLVLSIAMISSTISSFISGNSYSHYFGVSSLAAGCLLCFVISKNNMKSYAVMSAVAVYFLLNMPYNIEYLSAISKQFKNPDVISFLNKHKSDLDGKNLLSIKSGPVPYLFTEAIPTQKFIWGSHTEAMKGDEVFFYTDAIKNHPEYIITNSKICNSIWVNSELCHTLNGSYNLVDSIDGRFSYKLYKIK